jgi:Zn-dependent protease
LSTLTHPVVRNCPSCGTDLPLEALDCPQCHALTHGQRLEQLARDANGHEARGNLVQARELWDYSLTLLPADSRQAEWMRTRLQTLKTAIEAKANPPAPESVRPWVKKLGPLGPVALLLLKSKGLLLAIFKLKFLLSFFSFVAIYVALFGWRYGVGISVCLLIHEMGHYVDIRRRGLPAEMPVFLPGLGAYVRWTAMGVTRRTVAQIALAGPLAGWIAAALCFLIYTRTGGPMWAALARTGAVLNILNLIPVWVLDGGQACRVLGAVERAALLAMSLAIWLYSGEGIFFLVAAGCTFRFFTKDRPQQTDWGMWMYYASLLVALAAVLHFAPNVLANGSVRR